MDIIMFILGSMGFYLLIGMVPRLLSGKIRTPKKLYILLSIDAVIFVVANIAVAKPLNIIAAVLSIIILYLYFSKELRKTC